ncbi:MAG: histidine-type phosphatase [Bacteroidales bacterium]|nr:histidine-type phosphatase [Bacteroidales bacterium]
MKTKLLIPLLLLLCAGAAAQTSKKELCKDLGRTGSNYFAYPGPSQKALTPAPAGYEPFYISHYGRHGSRYMTDNKYYVRAIGALDSAARLGLLTPYGQDVLDRLQKGYADAWNRDGDLTALGGRQHREIAHRMYERFPSLLSQPLQVDARSSTVGRCMLSMFYFCQELQGQNPELQIRMDASKRDMKFVVEDNGVKPKKTDRHKEYYQRLEAMQDKAHNPARLLKTLFTDVDKASAFVDGPKLMEALYNVAEDLQNVPELGISLLDVFTKDELFNMWTCYNASWLLDCGLVPGSTPMYLQQKIVRDSIESIADRVIRDGKPTVSLRFSHDSSVLPLAYLIGMKEAQGGRPDIEHLYKYISIDKIIPMAGNIQLVFYRKDGSDDILVKFLLNENETTLPIKTDVAPYYHWQDVKTYWENWPN